MENTNSNEDISCDNVQNVSFDESKKLDSKENSTDTLNWTEEEEEKEVFEKSKENDSGPIFSLDSSENKTNPLKENDSEEFEWDDVDYDEGIQKDEENDSEHTFTLNKNENKVTSLNDNSWIEDSATKDSKEQEEVKKNINITPKKCWIEEDDDDDDMNFGNSKIGNKNIGSKISSNFTGGSFSLNDYQALKKNESENISEKLSTEEKRKLENVIVKTEEKKKELIEKPKTKLSQWADTEDDIKINTKEKLFEKTFLSTDSTTQNIFQVDESRVEKKPKKMIDEDDENENLGDLFDEAFGVEKKPETKRLVNSTNNISGSMKSLYDSVYKNKNSSLPHNRSFNRVKKSKYRNHREMNEKFKSEQSTVKSISFLVEKTNGYGNEKDVIRNSLCELPPILPIVPTTDIPEIYFDPERLKMKERMKMAFSINSIKKEKIRISEIPDEIPDKILRQLISLHILPKKN